MQTVVESIDPLHPEPDVIARAAAVLQSGGVVAFPTETVYGLGAAALDEKSVRRIFEAKGRPAGNPLIVHVTDVDAARRLTTAWPDAAQALAEKFWPGPLTLVLPKADSVPPAVTAGGPTIALRIPSHPVARGLIDAADTPLAAPSANPSTRVSATRAEHVLRGLNGRIEMILDGGPTAGGLESTVLDLSGPTHRLLRHGLIGLAELREALGAPIDVLDRHAAESDDALPSPGLLKKHYSPAVPLELADDDGRRRVEQLAAQGNQVGWITCGPAETTATYAKSVVHIPLGTEPAGYARRLYEVLHALEVHPVDRIVVERPPAVGPWAAINDRLRRAAAI